MDNILDVFRAVLELFSKANISYMVVGSLGSIVYGEPRMTKDMDLVIDISPQDILKLDKLFPIENFYCPPPEVLRSESVHRGQFNLIHHQSVLKIDVIIRKDTPHSIKEFQRRSKISFWKGFEAYVASPEDIIIKKLEYYKEGGSEKHILDIRGILANTEVDLEYLNSWILKLNLEMSWSKVNPSI